MHYGNETPSQDQSNTTTSVRYLHPGSAFLTLFLILFTSPIQGAEIQNDENIIIRMIKLRVLIVPKNEFILSELLSREGEMLLCRKTVEADRRHLNRLGIFRSVEIKSESIDAEGVESRPFP